MEFALVLPLMLGMLLAIFQFGIGFNNKLVLTHAVTAGANKAIFLRGNPNPSAVCAQAVKDAAAGLKLSNLTVTCTSTWAQGETVVVTGKYPYAISILGIVEKSGTMTRTTTDTVR